MKRTFILRSIIVLLFVSLGLEAILIAFDYSDEALVGRYAHSEEGIQVDVVLFRNHSFKENLRINGREMSSTGTWNRGGEAGIFFASGFLPLPKQEVRRMKDGGFYGYFERKGNLLPRLSLQADPVNYVLWKRISL